MSKETVSEKNRTRLLRIFMDRKFSGSQAVKLTSELRGKTDEEKERIAARLIRQIESGEITKE